MPSAPGPEPLRVGRLFDPDVISDFEKQNNCKITYDVFSNNEELLAKMQAGGAQFDIIMPSDYMVTTMRKLDMLEKLDLAKIPIAKIHQC